MSEPVCVVVVTIGAFNGTAVTTFLANGSRKAMDFEQAAEHRVGPLLHSRVTELRNMGLSVEVVEGDDPEQLAKAEAKAAAKARKAEEAAAPPADDQTSASARGGKRGGSKKETT